MTALTMATVDHQTLDHSMEVVDLETPRRHLGDVQHDHQNQCKQSISNDMFGLKTNGTLNEGLLSNEDTCIYMTDGVVNKISQNTSAATELAFNYKLDTDKTIPTAASKVELSSNGENRDSLTNYNNMENNNIELKDFEESETILIKEVEIDESQRDESLLERGENLKGEDTESDRSVCIYIFFKLDFKWHQGC